MNTDLQNLKLHIAALPAEKLFEMVTVNVSDYRREALDLAFAELQKRGYAESDLQKWYDSTVDQGSKNPQGQLSGLKFAVILFVTCVVTFWLFAPLMFYSIIAYGIPCTIFIAAGYLIWLALRRGDPREARAFGIGFAFSVSLLLLVYSIGVPWYTGMIVCESLFLWFLFRIIRPQT